LGERVVDYIRGTLSAVAAILVAEFVFLWPMLRGSKATGMAAFKWLLLDSSLSPRFWIVAVLLFGLFFAASRASAALRVLFFWIPTLTISVLGSLIVALYTYLFFRLSRHH
jgi:hypothetical protein